MNSHIRVNLEANFAALRVLDCSSYKVLLYLANRADSVGRCWPSVETIAEGCALHIQTVYKALNSLVGCGYLVFLRHNAYDPILGKKLPNVYMVSPHFLELSPAALVEATNLWNGAFTKISYINQQQNHVPLNSTRDQYHNQQQQGPETETAKSEPQTAEPQKQPAQRQPRSEAPKSKSSAIVNKYTNPVSITEALPDDLQELLAERINGYGIPKPMARGFVFKYGYQEVAKAVTYFEFVRAMQDISSAAGFFRHLLEHGAADEDLPASQQLLQRDYTGGSYADYVES
jgi:hypothetical protein